MRRLHWLTLASLGVLAACRQPDSALRVDVTIKSSGAARVRADCVKLAVLVNGEQVKSLIVARPMDDSLVLGVVKTSDLPQTVSLQLSGLVGPSCTDETGLLLNARGPVLEATFPTSGVLPFAMELEPPGRSLDADADNYVGASFGGPDCRDNDASVFPGATQICTSQNDTDCDGLVGCDDPGCSSAPFCQDQATKVVLTTPMNTMLRGDCLGPIRVELQNAFGPRKAVRDTPVTFTSSIGGVTVHNTATCTEAPLSSVPILYDQTFAEIYLKADETAFGTNTFTATAERVAMPGTASIEVHPRPFTTAKFTSMAQTLTAGTCGATPVTVELFDAQMRRTDVDSLTTINLTSNPGDLNNTNIFFSDPGCTTTAAQATLMPGQGQVTVYLLARRAGSFTLTATPSAGTGDTQLLTVLSSPASKLAFTNMELALQTTVSCSLGTLDIELQDQFGNPVTVTSDLGLSLDVVGPSPLLFFAASDTTCGVALSSYAIPNGASGTRLRVQATQAGSMADTITVSAVMPPSPLASATQNLYVSAGPASQYTWVGMPQQPLAGVCSAMPLTLQLLDSANNPSSLPNPVNFTLSATLGTPTQNPVDTTFRFYSGAGCQTDLNNMLVVPANTTQAQIYFRANKVRTNFEVRAAGTLTGPLMTSTGHGVLPNVPAKLSFSTTNLAQTAAAGSCSPNPYTVNVLDQYDNPSSFTMSQTVNVTSNPSGVNVGVAPACAAGNSVTLAANASNTTFNATATRVPGGGTYQLSASVSTFSTPSTAPATLTVTPATPQLTSTPSGALTLSAGTCQNISLVRQDMYLNNAPTSGNVNVGITFPAGAFDVFPQQDCNGTVGAPVPMNNSSQVSFSVRAKLAGTHLLSLAAQGPTTTLTVTITPGTPSLVFEAPASGTGTANATIQAGGCTMVTLARKDGYNNDVGLPSAQAMTFVTSDPSVTVHSMAGCTSPVTSINMAQSAARQTFYVKGTSTTMGWTVTSTLAAQSATLNLTVTPGTSNLSFLAPVGGSANVLANDCVIVTIERRDSQGNPVPIPMGTTTAALAATGSISAFDNSTCTAPAVGATIPVTVGTSSKTFSVKSTVVGTPSLQITLNGQSVTLNLAVSPNVFSTLVLENVPGTFTAGGCSTGIVVRRRDSYGNDITTDPPLTVNLTATGFGFSSTVTTCASPQPSTSVIIGTGSAVSTDPVYLTTTVAGAASVTATSSSPAAMVTANSTVSASTPTQLVFTTAPGTVTVPGCGAALGVELRDTFNNRVTPGSTYNVTVGSSLTATFFPRATCTSTTSTTVALTTAQPTGTFSFQPTASGTHTVSISGTGPTLNNSQMWTVNPGPVGQLRWRMVPTATPARFSCVAAGVVESRDGNGNPTNVTADTTVTLTPSASSLQFFSDAACTTPANTTVIPNGADVAPGLYMFATGGAVTVSLSSGALSVPAPVTVTPGSPSGSLVVTTGSPNLEAGGCTAITVTRKDGAIADLVTGTTLAQLASGSSSVELHTNATCTAPVASPASLTFSHGTSALSTLWAKGKSAAPATATTAATVTLTATSTGSTNGTVSLTVYPLVRRGACNLADMEASKRCVVSASNPPFPSVDISRSFLVFTSTGRPINGNSVDPVNQNVECHLDTNAGTSVDVVCTRAGTLQAMSVNYQVVSFGRDAASGQGISVQHFSQLTSTSSATTSIALTPSVDAGKSFFLTSASIDGTSNSGEAFPLVKFPSQTGSQSAIDVVSLTAAPTARTVSVQVVTMGWSTASASHTHSANPAVSSGNYDITTPTLSGTFPLVMATAADGSSADVMCKRRLNARAQSSSTVRLHRGSNTIPAACSADAVTAANIQRVLFPNQLVAVNDVTMNSMSNSGVTGFGSLTVVKDRAITLLAMQGPGGQSTGEANYAPSPNPDADDTGAFTALLDFNGAGTQVNLTRSIPGSTTVVSVFSVYVVQFDP